MSFSAAGIYAGCIYAVEVIMNLQPNLSAISVLVAALASGTAANAQEETFTWSGELKAGYLHDSNVNVRELDQNTERADQAVQLEGKLQAKWRPWRALELRAGAQHSDTSYQEFDDFDLALTTLNGEVSYDFGVAQLGVSRHDATAKLAGTRFLDYQQDSVYVSRLWTPQWFTRLARNDIDKDFNELDARDAEAEAIAADVYWFTPSAKSFVNVGYTDHDERAQDEQFSFNGHSVRVKWQTQSPLWGAEHTWQLGWQLQQRDYRAAMSASDAPREEQRQALTAQWQIPLASHMDLIPQVEYVDNQSNFADVDYQETTASVQFSVNF